MKRFRWGKARGPKIDHAVAAVLRRAAGQVDQAAVGSAGWNAHVDGVSPIHVWPVDDLIEHDLDGEDCVCWPRLALVETPGGDVWQVVHASLDGRESKEA